MEHIIRDAMRTRDSRDSRAERAPVERGRSVVRPRAALAGAGEDIGD
jgi:hypothetical protein